MLRNVLGKSGFFRVYSQLHQPPQQHVLLRNTWRCLSSKATEAATTSHQHRRHHQHHQHHVSKNAPRIHWNMLHAAGAEKMIRAKLAANTPVTTADYNLLLEEMMKQPMNSVDVALADMESLGVEMDATTYNILISGYCQQLDTDKAEKYIAEMKAKGFEIETEVYHQLLYAYSNDHKPNAQKALETVRTMKKNDVEVDTTAMNMVLAAFALNKPCQAAATFSAMQEMVQWGISPSISTFVWLLCGCRHAKRPSVLQGRLVLQEMKVAGLEPSSKIYSEFLMLCAKCVPAPYWLIPTILQEVQAQNVRITADMLAAAIRVYAQAGKISEMEQLLQLLDSYRMIVDSQTLVAVLMAYAKEACNIGVGKAEAAMRMLQQRGRMSQFGPKPFRAMIIAYTTCRPPMMEEAMATLQFMEKIGVEPDELTLKLTKDAVSLLSTEQVEALLTQFDIE